MITRQEKRNIFFVQGQYCAPDTWIRIEDTDSHFFQEIQKSLSVRKLSQIIYHLANIRSQ